MQRKLSITIADEVYRGLHQQIGRVWISRFRDGLVRPYLTTADELEAEYRAAAEDAPTEQEAKDWIEAHVDEALE